MKIKKNYWGVGQVSRGGGSEVFVNFKKNYFFFGRGGARVDVNREVKFL